MLHFRGFFWLCIALLSTLGYGQNWEPRGSIRSINTQAEVRNNSGVEGTEYFHYEYRVSTMLIATNDDPWKRYKTVHHNVCRGGKHDEHAKCDLSCCNKDTRVRRVSIRGKAVKLTDAMREMERESARIARRLGMPGGPANWSSETSNYLRAMEAECEARLEEVDSLPHDLPCTELTRRYGLRKSIIRVRGEFWKVGFYRSRGVDTPINARVGEQEGTVMDLWYPVRDVLEEKEVVICRCKAKPKEKPVMPDKPRYRIGSPSGKPIPEAPTFKGCRFYLSSNGEPCVPDSKQVEVECTGESLTKARISVTNRCDVDLICEIPVGCELIPADSSTQVMVCTESIQFTCMPDRTNVFYVSIKPSPSISGSGTLRVACTEIKKKEPSEKTQFALTLSEDPQFVALLEQPVQSSFFANALTQGQVWIYKDQASREEINKRLLPGLTDGMYLNALAGVAQSGVDLSQRKFQKCVDPALLRGSTASAQATAWLVAYLETHNPKGLASVVASLGSGPALEAVDIRHLANVVNALGQSAKAETRRLGIALASRIPENGRTEFAKAGGLNGLRTSLVSTDESEVQAATDVASKFAAPETKEFLDGIAFWTHRSKAS